jgi:hypothetical protein
VEKQKHASTGLIADARFLFCANRPRDQEP